MWPLATRRASAPRRAICRVALFVGGVTLDGRWRGAAGERQTRAREAGLHTRACFESDHDDNTLPSVSLEYNEGGVPIERLMRLRCKQLSGSTISDARHSTTAPLRA